MWGLTLHTPERAKRHRYALFFFFLNEYSLMSSFKYYSWPWFLFIDSFVKQFIYVQGFANLNLFKREKNVLETQKGHQKGLFMK